MTEPDVSSDREPVRAELDESERLQLLHALEAARELRARLFAARDEAYFPSAVEELEAVRAERSHAIG